MSRDAAREEDAVFSRLFTRQRWIFFPSGTIVNVPRYASGSLGAADRRSAGAEATESRVILAAYR